MTTLLVLEDINHLERDGFGLQRDVVSRATIPALIHAVSTGLDSEVARKRGGASFAIRDLLVAAPAIRDLADRSQIRSIVESILGASARVVRGILFDKVEGANWAVPPHQDITIAVRERIDTPGFGPWSIKAGTPHVQPPREVLESMLTLRIHLDDCPADAGALRVIPGSHRHGILSAEQLTAMTRDSEFETCPAAAGDCLVMRPLLIHASSPAAVPSHRRVVHLEFASFNLPNGLQWHEG